jgi:hypothetical protein
MDACHDLGLISVFNSILGQSAMRSLLILLATFAIFNQGASAIAQNRFRALRPGSYHDRIENSHRYATPSWGGRPPRSGLTLFGFSFGTRPYGYDYAGYPDPYFLYPYSLDPWARGSFRQPDLLDDPYFYDRVPSASRYRRPPVSRRFPRQSSGVPLELRNRSSNVTAASPSVESSYDRRHSTRSSIVQRDDGAIPTRRSFSGDQAVVVERGLEQGIETLELLQQANEEFLLNLARYDGGDAWIDFLGCERMIAHAVESETQQLRSLMARYDGVATDPAMKAVASIDGFDRTRAALRRYLQKPIESFESVDPPPAVESLPAPQPDLPREGVLKEASEV